MPVLCLIVFIDLLGFGIVAPLFPFVAERMGASPFWVTFGGAGIYSLMQLLATPVWGRLSDAYGRKPVLWTSMIGGGCAYLVMASATDLWVLIGARAVQGLMAGNVAAAFAYATDVSRPENRAKTMGMIGAAFGLGFTLGPAIGGWLGGSDKHAMNFVWPAFFAATLSFVAALGALLVLKESLPPEQRTGGGGTRRSASPFAPLKGRAVLANLVLGTLTVQMASTMMQSVYPLWANFHFHHGPKQVGLVFFALGVLAVFCQGVLAGRLTRRLGERRLVIVGVSCFMAGLGCAALLPTLPVLAVAIVLMGIGVGLFSPAASSLISLQAGPHERGAVMGSYNAANSLARVLGPMISGPVYVLSHAAPFLIAAALLVPALALFGRAQAHERDAAAAP